MRDDGKSHFVFPGHWFRLTLKLNKTTLSYYVFRSVSQSLVPSHPYPEDIWEAEVWCYSEEVSMMAVVLIFVFNNNNLIYWIDTKVMQHQNSMLYFYPVLEGLKSKPSPLLLLCSRFSPENTDLLTALGLLYLQVPKHCYCYKNSIIFNITMLDFL